jgi:hypothetical protein
MCNFFTPIRNKILNIFEIETFSSGKDFHGSKQQLKIDASILCEILNEKVNPVHCLLELREGIRQYTTPTAFESLRDKKYQLHHN